MGQFPWAHVCRSLLVLGVLAQPGSSAPAQTAQQRFIIHDKGLQQLGMDNCGEFGNPDDWPIWLPDLEYPGHSYTTFLFAAGLWVGGIRDGVPLVSVCTDGDDGTNEFTGLELGTEEDQANCLIGSVGWLEKSIDPLAASAQDSALRGIVETPYGHTANERYAHYLGLGRYRVDDDGDGRVDEDPAGDTSCDYQDNDGDGLYDGEDPDLDGDAVPGSRDDDGDDLIDEDDCARAQQEFITAYADTCSTCVDNPDSEGVAPLGLCVVQHSYQWGRPHLDDFILFEYTIRNIGGSALTGVALGMFADFDVEHVNQGDGSPDNTTGFVDSLCLATTADEDLDNGLLDAGFVGLQLLETSRSAGLITYANFDRSIEIEPTTNAARYALMVSGLVDTDGSGWADWRFVLSAGPLGDLQPGETMTVVFAIINGVEEQDLIDHATYARNMWESGLLGPSAPESPVFSLRPTDHGVEVVWANNAESSVDRLTGRQDFQGYRVWRTEDNIQWTLAASYDLPDTIGLNLGWPPDPHEDSGNEDGYVYEYVDEGLMNGARLRYVVTAFDDGHNGDGINTEAWDAYHDGTGVLESDRLSKLQEVVPAAATVGEGCVDSVYVVPNPYVGSSMLDRNGMDGRGVIEFRGLPPVCDIAIYTLAGDLVRELEHLNGLSWEAWDVRSSENREVAGGVYLYRASCRGSEHIGKLMVVR